MFRDITKEVDKESNQQQRPLAMNGFQQKRQVYLNEVIKPVEREFCV